MGLKTEAHTDQQSSAQASAARQTGTRRAFSASASSSRDPLNLTDETKRLGYGEFR
jgi:hypothetical protein